MQVGVGSAQPVRHKAVLRRAGLCEQGALALLVLLPGDVSRVTLALRFPSANASSLKEEFWIKLSSGCPKEWGKRKKKSCPASHEAAGQPCRGGGDARPSAGSFPRGIKKPFKASKLLSRPSPGAGLAHGAGTGCLPALGLEKLHGVFLASSKRDAVKQEGEADVSAGWELSFSGGGS